MDLCNHKKRFYLFIQSFLQFCHHAIIKFILRQSRFLCFFVAGIINSCLNCRFIGEEPNGGLVESCRSSALVFAEASSWLMTSPTTTSVSSFCMILSSVFFMVSLETAFSAASAFLQEYGQLPTGDVLFCEMVTLMTL